MQSTRDKAYFHLEKAEYWQSIAMDYEAAAEVEADKQLRGRMSRRDGLQTEIGYVADSLLRDNHGYKAACGNRNAHQRQAEVYMLAHLAGIRRTPWDRTADGLVKVEE